MVSVHIVFYCNITFTELLALWHFYKMCGNPFLKHETAHFGHLLFLVKTAKNNHFSPISTFPTVRVHVFKMVCYTNVF